jgi:hypothetical protein
LIAVVLNVRIVYLEITGIVCLKITMNVCSELLEITLDGFITTLTTNKEKLTMTKTMSNEELKKYVDAIYKAEKLLFDAEYELSKVLRDVQWMNDEEKGILLDFMKCYLRTKKYNYDNVEVSVMMRLGGCKNADEAKEKYYE